MHGSPSVTHSPHPVAVLAASPANPQTPAVFAASGQANQSLLHPNFELPTSLPPGSALILWSGTLASHDDPDCSLFEPDIGTWTKPGWTALSAACERVAPLLRQHDLRLWIRPHPAHVISDGPSMLKLLREVTPAALGQQAGEPRIAVLPDPALMLTTSMLPLAADHLDRLFAYIDAALAIANPGIILTNVAPPPPSTMAPPSPTAASGGSDGERFLVPCPPDQAVITQTQLARHLASLAVTPSRIFSCRSHDLT